MLDFKYKGYTVRERIDQMLGIGSDPSIHCLRACVAAFAIYTASHPGASFYIAPHLWVIGVLLWYFYPS